VCVLIALLMRRKVSETFLSLAYWKLDIPMC
jgi:hypothetical protein